MATIKHIFKGESLSMLFAFPAEYDMARIQSHGIWIGRMEFTGVIIGQGIELKLTSIQTDLMSGNQRVSLWIDDTILGVRKPYVGDIAVGNTNALPDNESTSEVYDVIVNVDISVTSIEAGDLMFNYVKGESAYQVWLDAGNTGTREDYFAYLQSPATAAIASIQAVESTVSGNEALRVTAENTRKENETARLSAEALRAEAETARQTNTSTAIQQTNAARDLALEVAEHPDKIVADYWWKWNTVTNAYENTNIMAIGGVYYPVFRLNPETGILSITADSDFTNTTFEIDKTRGTLILKINQ